MKTFIVAAILCLMAASAQAGLSKGPQKIETVRNAFAESHSVVKPAEPAKKKHKRRREDDDDINVDVDID